MTQVIVAGGGLAGLSAAHTVLERGGSVVIIDKKPFLGGNSVKATSGINGALTKTQMKLGIKDSPEQFLADTALSAHKGDPKGEPSALNKVLAYESAAAVDWLVDAFELDLSLVSRLGGHSFPRTHRGKERFPGATITMQMMDYFDVACKNPDGRARLITKAQVSKLLKGPDGAVIGCEYVKDGQTFAEHGPVILCTGGYGADYGADSILIKNRPDLGRFPTTNGDHCTGDGIKMALEAGGGTSDLSLVQVHPTGLVHPDDPNAKTLFLAAEALRGCGALLLDNQGERFCDELGRRDYVTGEMESRKKGPYRLVLNAAASKEIEWHCKHYVGRGLMKSFASGDAVANEMGIAPSKLDATFRAYNDIAKNPSTDPYGKKFFHNVPFTMNEPYHIAIVTPVVHYCMGGVAMTPAGEVAVREFGPAVGGLYAAGEVCGGVHGKNRLGGSSLLDCVVFGRVAGQSATNHLLRSVSRSAGGSGAAQRLANIAGHVTGAGNSFSASINGVNISMSWNGAGGAPTVSAGAGGAPAAAPAAPAAAEPAAAAPAAQGSYTLADVAKHSTEDDCWVVVNGEVLDVTKFLADHPGGKGAIMLFAGKDASAEFNMLHKPDVVEKFAPEVIIGKLKE